MYIMYIKTVSVLCKQIKCSVIMVIQSPGSQSAVTCSLCNRIKQRFCDTKKYLINFNSYSLFWT